MNIVDWEGERDVMNVTVVLNIKNENRGYISVRIAAFRNWLQDTAEKNKTVSLYDALNGLRDITDLRPVPIYAHLGWRCDDLIQLDHHITDNRLLIKFHCKRWL